jgi:hypothetical protein
VPVTAKFSKEFYGKLGHEAADALVDWFNMADAAYRTDLRETNELNFARFSALVDQRFAEQDAKWERRFAEQEAKWEQRLGHLETRLIRWMLGLWVTSFGAMLALLKLWVG